MIEECRWRGGTMVVGISGDELAYGPMIIFQDVPQETARNAGNRAVAGRVDQPRSTAQLPVLHGLMLD